jgi:hypothetical protein
VLTSSRLADALDLSKEDPTIRERYGTGSHTTISSTERPPSTSICCWPGG